MNDGAAALVGTSAVMNAVRASIRQAASLTTPVLLVGGPGTGKDLAAHTIHALSLRSAGAFAQLHCAALTETLFESELFGHVSSGGLFSDVPRIKPGRLELGAGGTLLINEIQALSAHSQVRLLRLLENDAYERVGGTETLKADVRVVATSQRPLSEFVKAGTFREDLHARLSAVQIVLPPLRDRPGDLEELVLHFLAKHEPTYGHQNVSVTHGALASLTARHWFGNVRDLENFVSVRLATTPPGDVVLDEAAVESWVAPPLTPPRDDRWEARRPQVEEALRKAGGNRSAAARLLGISRRTMYNMLEALGL